MTDTTYSAASGDGTICRMGLPTLAAARRAAQEIADQTGDDASICEHAGHDDPVEVEVVAPESAP